jgi:transaldolase
MSLLTYLRTQLTIDVDSMDPAVAARHAEAARFRDMTSNQAIVYREASRVERRDVFMAAVKEVQASASAELGEEERVERALDVLVGCCDVVLSWWEC